jgi:hypothetical protein
MDIYIIVGVHTCLLRLRRLGRDEFNLIVVLFFVVDIFDSDGTVASYVRRCENERKMKMN